MLTTETQAREKTCPVMRYCVNDSHVARDNTPPIYDHPRCIGSECMAWRWAESASHMVKHVYPPDPFTKAASGEPQRPEWVNDDYAWVPVAHDAVTREARGGFWRLTDEGRSRRENAVRAARKGFCGAFHREGVE